MQYDWKKIISSKRVLCLLNNIVCKQNNICVSSFYKLRERLENGKLVSNLFVSA